MEYAEKRAKQLPEKLKVTPTVYNEVKDSWNRYSDRETHKMKLENMLDFHYKLGTLYKMRVPIDPKNLAQMVHPHYGYLASMPVCLIHY